MSHLDAARSEIQRDAAVMYDALEYARAHAAIAQAEALERIANRLEILCDLIDHQTATLAGGR